MGPLARFEEAVRFVQGELGGDVQAHQMRILLMVARAGDDGVKHNDIEKALGVSHASISRNMQILGRRGVTVKGKKQFIGHELVESRPDYFEPRKLSATLTPKGKKLIKRLTEILEGSQ